MKVNLVLIIQFLYISYYTIIGVLSFWLILLCLTVINLIRSDLVDLLFLRVKCNSIVLDKKSRNYGHRCNKNVKPTHDKCGYHLKKKVLPTSFTRCSAITKKKKLCRFKAQSSSEYCGIHGKMYDYKEKKSIINTLQFSRTVNFDTPRIMGKWWGEEVYPRVKTFYTKYVDSDYMGTLSWSFGKNIIEPSLEAYELYYKIITLGTIYKDNFSLESFIPNEAQFILERMKMLVGNWVTSPRSTYFIDHMAENSVFGSFRKLVVERYTSTLISVRKSVYGGIYNKLTYERKYRLAPTVQLKESYYHMYSLCYRDVLKLKTKTITGWKFRQFFYSFKLKTRNICIRFLEWLLKYSVESSSYKVIYVLAMNAMFKIIKIELIKTVLQVHGIHSGKRFHVLNILSNYKVLLNIRRFSLFFLDLLISCSDKLYVELQPYDPIKKKQNKFLVIEEPMQLFNTFLLPMLTQPIDWTFQGKYGGYLLNQRGSFLSGSRYIVSESKKSYGSEFNFKKSAIEALNIIQRKSYNINEDLFFFYKVILLKDEWTQYDLKLMSNSKFDALLDYYKVHWKHYHVKLVGTELTTVQIWEKRKGIAYLREFIKGCMDVRNNWLNVLAVASAYEKYTYYFPAYFDFRGRNYSSPIFLARTSGKFKFFSNDSKELKISSQGLEYLLMYVYTLQQKKLNGDRWLENNLAFYDLKKISVSRTCWDLMYRYPEPDNTKLKWCCWEERRVGTFKNIYARTLDYNKIIEIWSVYKDIWYSGWMHLVAGADSIDCNFLLQDYRSKSLIEIDQGTSVLQILGLIFESKNILKYTALNKYIPNYMLKYHGSDFSITVLNNDFYNLITHVLRQKIHKFFKVQPHNLSLDGLRVIRESFTCRDSIKELIMQYVYGSRGHKNYWDFFTKCINEAQFKARFFLNSFKDYQGIDMSKVSEDSYRVGQKMVSLFFESIQEVCPDLFNLLKTLNKFVHFLIERNKFLVWFLPDNSRIILRGKNDLIKADYYLSPVTDKRKRFRYKTSSNQDLCLKNLYRGWLANFIQSIDGYMIRTIVKAVYDETGYIVECLHDSLRFHPNYTSVVQQTIALEYKKANLGLDFFRKNFVQVNINYLSNKDSIKANLLWQNVQASYTTLDKSFTDFEKTAKLMYWFK